MFVREEDEDVVFHWYRNRIQKRPSRPFCLMEDLMGACEPCTQLRTWVNEATRQLLDGVMRYNHHAYLRGSNMATLTCGTFTAEQAAAYRSLAVIDQSFAFDPNDGPPDVKHVIDFILEFFPPPPTHDDDRRLETFLSVDLWPYVAMAAATQEVAVLSSLHVQLIVLYDEDDDDDQGDEVDGRLKGCIRPTDAQLLGHVILAAHLSGRCKFTPAVANEMWSGGVEHAMPLILGEMGRKLALQAKEAQNITRALRQ